MGKYQEIVIFCLTDDAKDLINQLRFFFNQAKIETLRGGSGTERVSQYWREGNLLIFIMALGIVARVCAPLISRKGKDPAVMVIDELGKNIIPYLGGHYGELNALAGELAHFLQANPVITTSSDLRGIPALDLWIKKKDLIIKDERALPSIMAKINREGLARVAVEKGLEIALLPIFIPAETPDEADIIISYRQVEFPGKLHLIPRCLWLGIGFHETLREEDFERLIFTYLDNIKIDHRAIRGFATLKKKAEYPPLRNFCFKHKFNLIGFNKEELSNIKTISNSKIVKNLFDVGSVSEASALLASRGGRLLYPKAILGDITLAVALEEGANPGKLYVVGIGPGSPKLLTLRALEVLQRADAIVGYRNYLKRIEGLLSGKEVYSFSMREEVDRVKKAICLALQGKDTALVSGGDPGIYGMAGLVLEILAHNNLVIDLEIVPGVSALNAGNALLGAPLANDFAVISLSDRLTPWDTIERRLKELAKTDLPIVLFNPRSSGRKSQFRKAIEIIRAFRAPHTPVGIINSAYQEEERLLITTLGELPEDLISMQSLVIVCSENTTKWNNYLFARRGYDLKYQDNYEIRCSSV